MMRNNQLDGALIMADISNATLVTIGKLDCSMGISEYLSIATYSD